MRCFFIEPIHSVIGLATQAAKEPLIAKTIRITMISILDLIPHLFFTFSKKGIISHNIDFDAKVKTLFSMQKIVRWSFIKKIRVSVERVRINQYLNASFYSYEQD